LNKSSSALTSAYRIIAGLSIVTAGAAYLYQVSKEKQYHCEKINLGERTLAILGTNIETQKNLENLKERSLRIHENAFKLKDKSFGIQDRMMINKEASLGIQNKVANAQVKYYQSKIDGIKKK
jgi:hypothetical protein